ncbi:polysaccharide biosynthesis C-terminal domain-containing protein [Brochothrix thermosphacta]
MGWFLGAGFTGAGSVLVLLTPVILFLAWGSIIGNQFLLPMNRMRGYSIAVCSGLFVNVIINVLLIPQYGAQGAAVATSISEGVVLLAMMIIVRESLDQWVWLKELPLLIIAGGVMVSALLVMNKLPIQPVGLTFLQIIVGIGIYLVILYLFKTKTLNWLLDKISVVINKRRQK